VTLPELDAGIGIGSLAGGAAVPLTGQPRGPSGKPGVDRKAQEAGHRVKRRT
jgi:hypothetical protein